MFSNSLKFSKIGKLFLELLTNWNQSNKSLVFLEITFESNLIKEFEKWYFFFLIHFTLSQYMDFSCYARGKHVKASTTACYKSLKIFFKGF